MRTFKLISLNILDVNEEQEIRKHVVDLVDGLIINREDQKVQWIIEAYIDDSYNDFFHALQAHSDTIMLQAKISKESNDPALFVANIIGINQINDHMNVLFNGKIIDQRNLKIKLFIETLINQGYYGDKLYEKYIERIDKT